MMQNLPKLSLNFKRPDPAAWRFKALSKALATLPPMVDLSVGVGAPFYPPFDQGEIGSCGPTSLMKCIAWDNLKANGAVAKASVNFIYWNTRQLMGTLNLDSGVDNQTMLNAFRKFGWCDEELLPYGAGIFARPSQSAYAQATLRIPGIVTAVVPQSLTDMQACLTSTNRPWILGFSLSQSVYDYMTGHGSTTGIVPMPTTTEMANGMAIGGHDINAVGYNATGHDLPGVSPGNVWPNNTIKCLNHWYNSPGMPWGDGGFAYFPISYALNHQWAGDYHTVDSAPSIIAGPQPAPPTPTPSPVPTPPSPLPPVPPVPGGIKDVVDTLFAQAIAKYSGRPMVVAALRIAQQYIDAMLIAGGVTLRTAPGTAGMIQVPRSISIKDILAVVKEQIKFIGAAAIPIIDAYVTSLGLPAFEVQAIDALIQELIAAM